MFQLPAPPSVMCPISSQIERDEEVEEVWSGDSVEEEEEVTNDSPIKEGGDGKAAIENSDDAIEEPKMGMEFDSPNDAYLYYSKFAKEKGFAVAKRTSKKGKDGVLIHVVYECSKGGKARVRGSNLAKPRPQSKTECRACLTQERKWRVSRVIWQNYANVGPLMWPNIGPLMWPNMMAHNFQNPPNFMPTMQSVIRGGPQGLGRPHSSLMRSQLQEWQGVRPSFLEMMNGMNNKKE